MLSLRKFSPGEQYLSALPERSRTEKAVGVPNQPVKVLRQEGPEMKHGIHVSQGHLDGKWDWASCPVLVLQRRLPPLWRICLRVAWENP